MTGRSGSLLRRLRPSRSIIAGFALLIVMVAAAAVVIHYVDRVSEWRVMTDELLYVKLARGIADTGLPLPTVRGEHIAVYSVLYSLIISPFVGFLDAPAAFQAIRVVNVVVMVSAAIPTYLMSRAVSASRGAGLIAAALAVLVPWMAQATSLMTEVVAYPTFAWAVYAMTRAIASPSPRRDLTALAAIALACLARTQFVVLLIAFPFAALVHNTARARPAGGGVRSVLVNGARRTLRPHAIVFSVAAVGLLLTFVASSTVLGNYGGTVSRGSLLSVHLPGSALEHLTYITVGLGAVPVAFALAFAIGSLARPADLQATAFASVVVVVVAFVTLVVASFDLRFSTGAYAQERYLFYICPLLLVGAVAWFSRGHDSAVALAIGSLATAAVVLSRSYDPHKTFAPLASPNRYFFAVFDGRLRQVEGVVGLSWPGPAIAIATACVVLPALVVVVRRRLPRVPVMAVFGVGVAAFLVAQLVYVLPRVVAEHNRDAVSAFGERNAAARDWVDRRVAGRTAALEGVINSRLGTPFFNTFVDRAVWWDVEFWNKSVDRVYRLGADTGDDLTMGPIHSLTLDFASGDIRGAGDQAPKQLVLTTTDARLAPEHQGSPVHSNDLTLYRTPLPYRADWATRNIGDDGWTVADRPTIVRLYARRGARAERREMTILLHGGADVGGPRRVTISAPGTDRTRVIRDTATERVDVCVPARGHSDVTLDVDGRTRLSRRRVVGLRVLRISSTAAGGGC